MNDIVHTIIAQLSFVEHRSLRLVCLNWNNISKNIYGCLYDIQHLNVRDTRQLLVKIDRCKKTLCDFKEVNASQIISRLIRGHWNNLEMYEPNLPKHAVVFRNSWYVSRVHMIDHYRSYRWCSIIQRSYGNILYRSVDFFVDDYARYYIRYRYI